MIARRLLQVAASTILALFILEIGIRLSGFTWYDLREIDPATGLLRFTPRSEIHIKRSCFENTVKSNSYGFHAREYAEAKPAGVTRIALFGDSMVEGAQVPLEKTLAAQLEALLNERGYKTEVRSFGISSRGTYLNLRTYEAYGVEFKPDIVINAFLVSNDLDDDTTGPMRARFTEGGEVDLEAPLQPHSTFLSSLRSVARNSALVMTLYRSLQNISAKNDQLSAEGVPKAYAMFEKNFSPSIAEAWDIEEKLFTTFAEKVKEQGATFMVVSLTEGYRVHPQLLDEVFADEGLRSALDFTLPERKLSEILDKVNIPYLALIHSFRERASMTEELSILPCDGHWSEVGHRWAAEAIADFLISKPSLLTPFE